MLDKEDLNYINGVIDSLQRMTSGNVAHLRSGCIGALRSLIDLNELRAEHANAGINPQPKNSKLIPPDKSYQPVEYKSTVKELTVKALIKELKQCKPTNKVYCIHYDRNNFKVKRSCCSVEQSGQEVLLD